MDINNLNSWCIVQWTQTDIRICKIFRDLMILTYMYRRLLENSFVTLSFLFVFISATRWCNRSSIWIASIHIPTLVGRFQNLKRAHQWIIHWHHGACKTFNQDLFLWCLHHQQMDLTILREMNIVCSNRRWMEWKIKENENILKFEYFCREFSGMASMVSKDAQGLIHQ